MKLGDQEHRAIVADFEQIKRLVNVANDRLFDTLKRDDTLPRTDLEQQLAQVQAALQAVLKERDGLRVRLENSVEANMQLDRERADARAFAVQLGAERDALKRDLERQTVEVEDRNKIIYHLKQTAVELVDSAGKNATAYGYAVNRIAVLEDALRHSEEVLSEASAAIVRGFNFSRTLDMVFNIRKRIVNLLHKADTNAAGSKK